MRERENIRPSQERDLPSPLQKEREGVSPLPLPLRERENCCPSQERDCCCSSCKMSNKAKSSGVSGGSQAKKIKGPLATLFNSSSTKEQIMNSMNSRFVGKRILLKALDIYGGRGKVPPSEEDFLFQYHLVSINNDCKSALLHYDEKCIKNGGDQFTSYPDTTGNESTILNYRLELFSDDHELFNTHQGRVNRIINDEKDLMRKMEQGTMHHNATDNVSDLDAKISDGSTVYALLVGEFEPCGDFCPHTIAKGPHQGKQLKKQKWSKCVYCQLIF